MTLYAFVPVTRRMGSVALFVGCFALIMSMCGGGFATIPAYLGDLFGTGQVGAIHGRLLTAWSAAGIAGRRLISRLREHLLANGTPATEAYSTTMLILAGLLGAGLASNALVKPLAVKPAALTRKMKTEGAAPMLASTTASRYGASVSLA